MKKSVYSLVLMDRVVDAVDQLAYQNNTNRSNMINQILAEYVSLVTPQDRKRLVFHRMEHTIGQNAIFKILPLQSDTMMVIKSALNYKYNPVIKYSVELYNGNHRHFGCMKVAIRTQNETLIRLMNRFFRLWQQAEYQLIDFRGMEFHLIENGRLQRQFMISSNPTISEEEIGTAISNYLETLDACVKLFFQYPEREEYIFERILQIYKMYLKQQTIVI